MEKRAAAALKELQRRREGGARRARRGNGNAPPGSADGRGGTEPGAEPSGLNLALDLEPYVPEERAAGHRPARPASADPKKRTAAPAPAPTTHRAAPAVPAAAPAAAGLEGWGDGLELSEEVRRVLPCSMQRTVHMHRAMHRAHAPCTCTVQCTV